MAAPLRIANCSGFYGDRLSAAREMVDGGPIDVLTGDWLAELTMLILAKNRQRDPRAGYARTFVQQMEQVMGTCLDRGIKVVANAGGLSPAGCAAAVQEVADRLGLAPSIAAVAGDDLLPRMEELRAAGVSFDNLDTGEPLGDREVLTANAYVGGWGIVEALQRGADIVVTGRTTDAAVVIGPAAWHHGWSPSDLDPLAGAVVAGHIVECGAQATGGNYAFFREVPGLEHPGFPIAEVAADGSSVITKHEGQGGMVTVGTVTAQLLYEIGPPAYLNPDVTARFDTIRLAQQGPDRVLVSGVRGEAPPDTLKVCINLLGGVRTSFAFALTGLDIDAKAELLERSIWASVGGREQFAETHVALARTDHEDPETNEAATSLLRVTVKDPDERKVGKAFTAKLTELALASYPGFYGAGSTTQTYGVYWPALLPGEHVAQEVTIEGETTLVERTPADGPAAPIEPAPVRAGVVPDGPTARVPLGRIIGARSGDKGGNANLGLWARTDAAYAWLRQELTEDRLRALLPEAASLPIARYELGSIRALNFVIVGLLGEGVASSTRTDAQAKSLGEHVRARHVDIPVALLDEEPDA